MTSLNQIIDNTQVFQDVELATAVGKLKQNPAELQQFLQAQQGKVYSDVVKQKDSTFQKVYGDLNRASQAQQSILMLNKRNKEMAAIQEQVYANQEQSASVVTNDKNLAGRKYEMNEWTVHNKGDTLFVFSMLFIVLCALIFLSSMWRLGFLSTSLLAGIALILIAIFVFTIVNRSQYTNIMRNKRYWNKNTFNDKYGKIPVPLCPNLIAGIEGGYDSVVKGVGSGISGGMNILASATESAAQGLSSAAKGMAQNAAPAT